VRVVDEAREVVDACGLDDTVEEAVDAGRAVVEPPRAAELHRRIVARHRRELAAVRALVEREENDVKFRVIG